MASQGRPRLVVMPSLGPAYLIHGDDHGAIAERRARLRAVADGSAEGTSIEVLDGANATPEGVAAALAALRLGGGHRVIVVDGAERFKDAEVKKSLVGAMAQMPPDTTLALFAYEDQRAKAPPSLHRAISDAGGQVAHEATLKPWELPRWVVQQGRHFGLALNSDAAKALVAHVGDRRQRLLRELEKLALETDGEDGAERAVDAEAIEQRVAQSAEVQAWALADTLVADAPAAALGSYLRLRAQGDRLPGLLYSMASRLRQALVVASRLERGEPAASVRKSLRMPSKPAERLIADAQRAGAERLRQALGVLADLELHSRGGPVVRAGAGPDAALQEDTLAVRAIAQIAGEAK